MTTATTPTFVTMTCKVNGSTLTLTGPEGKKSITLATNRLRECDDNAQRIINEILALADVPGVSFYCDVEIPELKILAGLPIVTKLVSPAKEAEKVTNRQCLDTSKAMAQKTERLISDNTAGCYTGNQADDAARRLHILESAAAIWNEQWWTINYDIPTWVSNHPNADKRVSNPCAMWRRSLLKDSLSGHVCPENELKSGLVANWIAHAREQGCVIRVRRVHPDDMHDTKVEILRNQRDYLVSLHTSLIERIANADKKLAEAKEALLLPSESNTETKTEQQLQKERDLAVRAIINGKAKELDDAIALAEKYDMTGDVSDLLDALRAAVRAEAISFNATAYSKGIKRVDVPK